jgi:hypothetical protein
LRTFKHIHRTKDKFPSIPLLDIFYYDIKGKGMRFFNSDGKRPKFHLYDNTSLFSVVPLISESNSPYVVTDTLRYRDKKLPINIKQYPPVNTDLGYFYFRSTRKNIQTLDKEIILNLNFNPKCLGCEFCYRKFDQFDERKILPISVKEGIELIIDENVDFANIHEIAIVTGLFSDEMELFEHIKSVLTISIDNGFAGRILYLGSQLISSKVMQELLSMVSLTYVYTVETFSKREILHPSKNKSLNKSLLELKSLRDDGVENLQFTYMPGIDSIDVFDKYYEIFSSIATPHISIFRPIAAEQKKILDELYLSNPTFYLCYMRSRFENYFSDQVLGNNLGNLWAFPKERIDSKFFN